MIKTPQSPVCTLLDGPGLERLPLRAPCPASAANPGHERDGALASAEATLRLCSCSVLFVLSSTRDLFTCLPVPPTHTHTHMCSLGSHPSRFTNVLSLSFPETHPGRPSQAGRLPCLLGAAVSGPRSVLGGGEPGRPLSLAVLSL